MIKEKLEISKFKMLCIFIMIYQLILLIPVINKHVSLTGLMALFILPELFISYRIVKSINCIRNFKMQDISDPSNGNYIYSYRIVDFNNKREVNIRMYGIENRNFYSQDDKVTVIHGAISKMVLHHYIIS